MNFSASLQNLTSGEKSQLCFQLKNASRACKLIRGVPRQKSERSQQCVSVRANQATTLHANGAHSEGKNSTKQTTIRVTRPAPPIINFSSQRVHRRPGWRPALLHAVNAGSLQINHGVGEVGRRTRGCINTRVEETTTFTLTATGSEGEWQKSGYLTINQAGEARSNY